MNEQLQQALAAILNKTISGVEAGASFLAAEVPDVIFQLLLWNALASGVKALLWMAALATVYLFARSKYCGKGEKGEDGRCRGTYTHNEMGSVSDRAALTVALMVIIAGVALPAAVYHALMVLKILVAPKIYLIEYAASLAK